MNAKEKWEQKEDKTENFNLKSEPVPSRDPQVNIMLSETDAFIADRIKSQPKTLTEIETQVLEKPREGYHNLSLPNELKDYEKRFAFCWIFKHPRAIDQACTLYHWVICNKVYFSEVSDKSPHLFNANGVIMRGDEILMFRSKKVDEEMRKVPGLESAQMIKNRTQAHEGDPAFYIPKSDEFETDPKTGKRVKVPMVGV